MAQNQAWGSHRTKSRACQVLQSIHEGWAYHFTPDSRKWMKRWLVLDGSRLVIFTSDQATLKNIVVSLNLGQGTRLKDVALQPNVYGLDIELTTMKGNAAHEVRTDFFGFSTPNECDLWKAYILGFSYGVVPDNLNLLPGQLRDVREAMLVNGPAPPPLPQPNPKRPSIQNVLARNQQKPTPTRISPTHVPANGIDSPYSHIKVSEIRSQLHHSAHGGVEEEDDVEEEEDDEEEDEEEEGEKRIRQLEQRRVDLAKKALEKEVERQPISKPQYPVPAHGHHPRGTVRYPSDPLWNATQRIPIQKTRRPILVTNNNEVIPPFYADPARNLMPPPWFVYCSRETAEMILTAARSYGNILMRPSFNINQSETYVISMRRDLPGGLELRHYAVYRTVDGFKLDVVDKHNPMCCLSDVMNFFTRYIGPSAQLINARDVEGLLGSVISPSPRSFPLSPGQQGQISPLHLADLDSSQAEKKCLENVTSPGRVNQTSEEQNLDELKQLTLDETEAATTATVAVLVSSFQQGLASLAKTSDSLSPDSPAPTEPAQPQRIDSTTQSSPC